MMQEPVCDYPLKQDKETYTADHLLNKEIELHVENVDLSENSDSENDIFIPWETEVVSICTDRKRPPTDSVQRRGFSESSFLLKFPFKEYDGCYTAPFQFDRHALGRISTSPTLRRLRNSVSSASQVQSLQDCFDDAKLGCQKEHSGSFHVCKNPPQCIKSASSSLSLVSCLHAKLLSSKENAETTLAALESAGPKSQLPHHKDNLSNGGSDQTMQNSGKISSATLPRDEHTSQPSTPHQEYVQERELLTSRSAERRRSSIVVSLPGLEVFPGDLLVSDSAVDYLHHSALLPNAESKKSRWPFIKKGASKDKKQMSDLENCLSTIKITDCSGYEFCSFKNKTWHEFVENQWTEQKDADDCLELKKEAAVWELFTSECTYFLDHLLVLKMIFMNSLKYLQSNEFFLDVDLRRLFGNLEELSQVSLSFVTSFFQIIKDYINKSESSLDFISMLTKYFHGNLCQTHQIYCLNYTSAVFYLENLRQREDFGIYLKWCEQHEQCKRLHLTELLVAPLHRLTRYPLLLNNIWKRSNDSTEKVTICSIKEKVEKSIRDLEGKVKWLDNFQKCRQLQEVIIWPQLWDRDKRFFVPECLKHTLRENLSENILSSTNRHLLHEGKLALAESTRFLDVYLFLFDDFLLITKMKRNKKKYGGSDTGLIPVCPSLTLELQLFIKEGGFCIVLDQPIPLDRLVLKNIDPFHVTVFGLRHAFLIQHENRYQQCIAVFLLQAQTETVKKTWMSQIKTAVSNYAKTHETKKSSIFSSPAESSEI
ncbi:pleckstrin homology domain-containing family G member 7 isoform X2 [Alligator sinensis]|uniref:Pleckstrin homology domain-containing family G member 7 isoform X2 n=1 Tax=Alligator sinensis TaxID=38654 RepID=A0A1U8D9H7_ALLSI|nr:pleckstrin homology domain-containing family G member 7 isoform X2 [Alligator sinensis]